MVYASMKGPAKTILKLLKLEKFFMLGCNGTSLQRILSKDKVIGVPFLFYHLPTLTLVKKPVDRIMRRQVACTIDVCDPEMNQQGV